MFGQGKITYQKVLGYYFLILFISIIAWLTLYERLNDFLRSDFVNSAVFILAVVGLFYVATISKLKDILIVKMFDTVKYDNIYQQANMRKNGQAQLIGEECYTNKYGPLNHLVDMVRACGWTMILVYPLFICLKHIQNNILIDVVNLFVFALSLLTALISTYFIYANLKVLYKFNK